MRSIPCPCGTGQPLERCCGPALDGSRPPPNAEALMRSRYTAFALQDEAYLLNSWHPATRPLPPLFDEATPPRWIGLQIRAHRQIDETHAEVEFVARYRVAGRAHRLHETSRFVREDGHWRYVDGDLHEAQNKR